MHKEREAQERRMHDLIARLAPTPATATAASTMVSIPSFAPFNSTSELWKDYWARFKTFAGANSVREEKLAQVFLTNQTTTVYKLLSTLAGQQTPPKDVNQLSIEEIAAFMQNQFDPKRFIVRERFKFWSDTKRKPGETIQELAARIRQDAAKCDFTSIRDPQDEAMRTRFICAVNKEAVLKALFKINDDELTFTRAIQVAVETEDAAKVAKETVYGAKGNPVLKLQRKDNSSTRPAVGRQQTARQSTFPRRTCPRCGKTDHFAKDCRFKDAECHFCKKKGHLESVCLTKKKAKQKMGYISAKPVQVVNQVSDRDPFHQLLQLNGKPFIFEVDTGSPDNFCSRDT